MYRVYKGAQGSEVEEKGWEILGAKGVDKVR